MQPDASPAAATRATPATRRQRAFQLTCISPTLYPPLDACPLSQEAGISRSLLKNPATTWPPGSNPLLNQAIRRDNVGPEGDRHGGAGQARPSAMSSRSAAASRAETSGNSGSDPMSCV